MAKTVTVKPKFKSYITDFTLHVGPMNIRGRMVGVRKPEASTKVTTKLVSPDGNPVEQKYLDPETGKYYTSAECNRLIDTTVAQVIVTKEELDTLKASDLPENIMELTAHSATQVNDALFPEKGNGYVFIPSDKDPKNVKLTSALVAAITESPDKAFVGMCKFHGHEGLYRVTVWRGYLCFVKQLFTSDVQDHEVQPIEFANEAKMIKAFLDKQTKAFEPEAYRNQAYAAQKEALLNPVSLNAPKPAAVEPVADLSSILAGLENWEG